MNSHGSRSLCRRGEDKVEAHAACLSITVLSLCHGLISGKSSERHAEGARPPRRQKYILGTLGLLSQSRSSRFPL